MNNKQQIEIEFDYNKELFREAYKSIFDSKVKPQNFIWLGVLLLLVFFFSYKGDNNYWFYLPLLGIPFGFLFAKFYLTRKWGDRSYKQYAGKKAKWIITKSNVQIVLGKSSKTVAWNYFEKASIGKEVVLLVTTDNVLTPIPVNAFNNDDLELFKEWLDAGIYGSK